MKICSKARGTPASLSLLQFARVCGGFCSATSSTLSETKLACIRSRTKTSLKEMSPTEPRHQQCEKQSNHHIQNAKPRVQTDAIHIYRSITMHRTISALTIITLATMLAACASNSAKMMTKPFDQSALPATVQVPAGHAVAMETVGVGSITYECKLKANTTDQYDWVFAGPDAKLLDRNGKIIGKYFGPPATWQSDDGSKVTGAQLAVSPAQPGSIPLQLVKANPATGDGVMKSVAYIQRVATKGGVAPASKPCNATFIGSKEVVQYQADYIFWRAV
jgi:Protein of unknown function (DUF3455)